MHTYLYINWELYLEMLSGEGRVINLFIILVLVLSVAHQPWFLCNGTLQGTPAQLFLSESFFRMFESWLTTNGKVCRHPGGQTRFRIGSRHWAAAFSLQVPKSGVDLDPTLLYISILQTYSKIVRKTKMLALIVCFPQPCSSAGRRFAASRSRMNYYRTLAIGLFPRKRIQWNAL